MRFLAATLIFSIIALITGGWEVRDGFKLMRNRAFAQNETRCNFTAQINNKKGDIEELDSQASLPIKLCVNQSVRLDKNEWIEYQCLFGENNQSRRIEGEKIWRNRCPDFIAAREVASEVLTIAPQGRPTTTPVTPFVSPMRPVQPVINYRSFMRVGDSGFEVRRIQRRLRALNYYRGPVNGLFDRRTEDAVVRFQQANGITQTGIVGPTTQSYLVSDVPQPILPSQQPSFVPAPQGQPPDPPLSRGVIGIGQGDQGPGVRDLQNRLRELGYFNSESTGFFGSITRNAVINFQLAFGIPATGLVSEETLFFLNNNRVGVGVLPENPIVQTPPNSRILRRGDNHPRVGFLQQRLSWLGYYDGRITEKFDERTEQAVINFQHAYGIQPTGQVEATTEGYLLSATGGVVPSFPTVPVANPPLPLRLGDRGVSVSFVQQQLQILGYYTGSVNGIFDLQTRRSVLAFQRDYGIYQTGVVGATTQSYLVSAVPENPIIQTPPNSRILRRGDNHTRVGVLQQRLSWLGFYNGRITEKFDERTEQAVINFQRAYGIQPTGQVGATTEAYIERAIGSL